MVGHTEQEDGLGWWDTQNKKTGWGGGTHRTRLVGHTEQEDGLGWWGTQNKKTGWGGGTHRTRRRVGVVGHTEQEDGLGWWVGVVGWVGGACTTERMGLLGGLRQGPHGARGEDGALHFGTPAQRFANWSSLPLHVPLPSRSLSLSFYRLFSLSLSLPSPLLHLCASTALHQPFSP